MPPRFVYWTILIDNAPTAFRARDQNELVPTLHQLKRTNENVVLKWFARGRLWASQEEERADFQRSKFAARERRGKDWRPGGDHKDPRARFDKEKRRRDKRDQRELRNSAEGASQRPRSDKPRKPWGPKPPRRDRPWAGKPGPRGPGLRSGPPRRDKPWSGKPSGPRKPSGQSRKPWGAKPPHRDQPWQAKRRKREPDPE